MKSVPLILTSFLLLAAYGSQQEHQSELTAEKFAIGVLGIEMGSCTRNELARFVAGENVPAISDKLPRDQQIELRQKFGRVLKFSPVRASEALASQSGVELNKILESVFPRDFSKEKVSETFIASVEDGSFTLLEFVSRYPVDQLRVNGLSFMAKKAALEDALVQLEDHYK